MKQYFYNEITHRLHIKGYCKESKILPYHVRWFDTYDEALAFDGRCVGLCRSCAKHENKLRKEETKRWHFTVARLAAVRML